MPIIFGGISFHLDVNQQKIETLKEQLTIKDCEIFDIQWGSLTLGISLCKNQPEVLEDFLHINNKDQILVLISGHIFNRKEIADLLRINIKSSTPELILNLYLKFQNEFIDYLNGEFVILVYDKRKSSAFLYRDHVGIHPLSYSMLDNELYFSSDIITLCKSFYNQYPVEKDFLAQFLQHNDYFDSILLPTDKVKKLLPGHYLYYSGSETIQRKYWFPEKIKTNNSLDFETVKHELKQLANDSVKIRSDKRYNASAHLSGGLDSGLVAGLAKKEYQHQKNFYGFSWSPQVVSEEIDKETDERFRLLEIEESLKIKTVFCDVSLTEFKRYHTVWHHYSPLIFEHKVLEECKKQKVNLIFSGWGGDEFISIDNIGIDYDLFFGFKWVWFFRRNPLYRPLKFTKRFLYSIVFPLFRLDHYTRNPKDTFYLKYLKSPYDKKKLHVSKSLRFRSRKEAHLSYLYDYHLSWRTESWTILGHVNGVEYRYPLLDKRIIEYMLKIPIQAIYRKNGYRQLMREICEEILPESVRLHPSKFDGAYFMNYENLLISSSASLFSELNEIEKNKEFDFVNFDRIKQDINDYRTGDFKGNIISFLSFLIYLKQTHAFVLGYKGKPN